MHHPALFASAVTGLLFLVGIFAYIGIEVAEFTIQYHQSDGTVGDEVPE